METLTLEKIFVKENIDSAMKNLLTKKDSCGIDGMYLSELMEYWSINGDDVLQMIFDGKYTPGPVRNTEIVNYKGKKRTITLYNSLDRLILKCIADKLSPVLDIFFTDHCYAFRAGFGIEEAVKQSCDYLEAGYKWIAEIDIHHYFDYIQLGKLEKQLRETNVADEKTRHLLHLYLYPKVEENGEIKDKKVGIVQGNAISPSLSNLYLADFDKELEKRGYSYCRYCDDLNVYFKTYDEAEKCYQELVEKLDQEYRLPVNKEKSGVFEGLKQKYLGYTYQVDKDSGKITAIRSKKSKDIIYNKWNRDAVQKIDRSYHIINDGILTKRDYNILFESDSGKKYLPVETTQAINIHSDVIFSAGFFEFMSRNSIDVNIFDRYGEMVGTFSAPRNGYSARTMLKQALIYQDEKQRGRYAKSLEMAAMHNLRANLKYYLKQEQSEELSDAVDEFGEIITQMNQASEIDEMMLIEARARELYYNTFNEMIHVNEFFFQKRTRRPPKDPINALISFGNTYMYNRIATEIRKTSLDIRIGFIHSTTNRNQSLNLDLAELFKPVIVDRAIFTLVNKHIIDANEHFAKMDNGGIFLNRPGKRIFINALDDKIYQKQTLRDGRTVSYDTRIREEIQKIYRAVTYGEKYKPYKYTN